MTTTVGVLVLLVAALVPVSSQGTRNITCNLPFSVIGGKCLYVDPFESGSWYDMRLLCSITEAGADLVTVDNADLLTGIIDYINEFGLNHAHYWIGASDEDAEGEWEWRDGSLVRMGAPFWRYDCDGTNALRPQVNPEANCAALDLFAHYLISDFSCLGDEGNTSFSPICEGVPVYLHKDDDYYDYEDEADEENEMDD